MASATPTYDKLRWRLKKFVDGFIETGNATEAMRRVGFKGGRPDAAAGKLKMKPKIRQAIAERQALAIQEAGRSAAEVLKVIWETVDRCRQVVPVLDDKGMPALVKGPDGNLAAAYVFDSKSVLKGAELLGKHHKLFTEKVEHTGSDGGPIQHKAQVVIFPDGGPGCVSDSAPAQIVEPEPFELGDDPETPPSSETP